MNENKELGAWTPGPWRAEPQDMFGDVNIILADDSEDSRAIACAVSNLRPDHEIIANADLIVAAPDLYEALAMMVAEKVDYMRLNKLGDPDEQHTIKVARAALARARGEQP